ncbi:MAG TPA: peptidyl-prolyl cis-trans isomerase [Caulobacteraceae bacterium]|nr:peptidyl-prolyl cis-trans isomerase [Caulobacteraceae bacterium]
MLAFFRMLSQSKITWVIIGLPLVAGFLLIGNTRADLSGMFIQNAVITAGSRAYSPAEFKREFETYRSRMAQQGQAASVDDMVSQGVVQQMLQAFAKRESQAEQVRRDGIVPDDSLIVTEIRKIAAFFDPISGKFDQKTYEQRLGENQLTPETFQRGLRDEAASGHMTAGLEAGLKPPRLLAAALTDFAFETHSLSFFLVNPKLLGAPPTPTDAQLKAIMDANAQALTTPETRVFTVARFSAKALAATVTADPAEVQKRFDFRKETLSTPERRTLVQIPAKSAAEASAIAAKLAKGADPVAVAKESGEEPLTYTDQPKGGVADPKVADAAFALPEGKASGAIQGQLGFAVVKILKITPGHQVTLDEVRSKIEAEIKGENATNKAYDLSQKYEDAHDKGAGIDASAKAAGVSTSIVGPVTAQGQGADGKPSGLSPKLLATGFALGQGAESDVVQEDKGEYFVLRADKVIAPQPPVLDKVRAKLTQYFQQSELQKRMAAKLDGIVAQVKKGQTMEAAAASVGAKVTQASMNRQQAQSNQQIPAEQLERIFQAKAGDVFASGAAVVKVTAVQAPPMLIVGQAVNPAQDQLRRQLVEELGVESGAWAQTKLKTKINQPLALQAIGASADAGKALAPALPGAPPPAKRAQ